MPLLWVAGNPLTTLPPEIGALTNLRKLHAAGCKLAALSGEIGRLASLRELYLEGNVLEELPADVAFLEDLERLILHDNRLTRLPEQGMSRLGKLKHLSLWNNPFSEAERDRVRRLFPQASVVFDPPHYDDD